jgi:hypothetical protein
MRLDTSNFKAVALNEETLRQQAPSIFAAGPMANVSPRYTFVPTARIVDRLREHDWVPVVVEEQHIRNEARRGFQKHLIRFRRLEQMQTLDEWNVELVLLNSHDCGCAYQLHAGIYRRICSNGLVLSQESFEAIRFRHAGHVTDEVVQASFRLLDFVPRVGELVNRFQSRLLEAREAQALAEHALVLRYDSLAQAPINAETLLQPRRPEDAGADFWTATNRLQLCGALHNAVMEVVETEARVVDQRAGNLLAERGHHAQLRPPLVQERGEELRRLHPPGEHRQAVRPGEARHEQFVGAVMGILPEPFFGVDERLRRVVGGDAGDRDPLREVPGQQFLEHMVTSQETAQDRYADLGGRRRRCQWGEAKRQKRRLPCVGGERVHGISVLSRQRPTAPTFAAGPPTEPSGSGRDPQPRRRPLGCAG